MRLHGETFIGLPWCREAPGPWTATRQAVTKIPAAGCWGHSKKKKMSVSKNDSSQLTVANPSKLILHQQGVMKRIVPSYPRQNTQQKCVNLLGSQGLVWTRFFCQLTRLALPAFGGIFRSGEECGKKLFLRTSSIVKQEKPTSLSRCGGTVFGTLYFMILYILFWINKT